MGQGASSGSASSQAFPRTALHCLRVQEDSPAYNAGIQPFFDYLIGVELLHRRSGAEEEVYQEPEGLTLDPEELGRVLDENEGKEIGLRIWNSKAQSIRYVTLTPSRVWHNSSSDKQQTTTLRPSLLGLSMRLCDPGEALGQVWHILEVLEGSPAESAGLVPYGDYVVGWTEGPLHTESDFYDLVEQHIDKPLRLYVYSADLDNLREIVLIPNRHWGGEGLLGCGVGYGLLHRIPIPSDTMQASHAYLPSAITTNVTSGTGQTDVSRSSLASPAKQDKGKSKAETPEYGYAVSS
ncbi:hypothetical protein NliqN6_3832 [Naganishia liquefaciens]|uniref:PDZ GRASP-type domain-containing protein n=1 Tax=Naganishia liquefaciens TaxID=104408 RepID=A0A8H3YF83_9TREE|nr:hypothetical protein NliqN6_3832 [Naganishia liquefaciens]